MLYEHISPTRVDADPFMSPECHTPLTLSLYSSLQNTRGGGRQRGGACTIIHRGTRALPLVYPPLYWYYSTWEVGEGERGGGLH